MLIGASIETIVQYRIDSSRLDAVQRGPFVRRSPGQLDCSLRFNYSNMALSSALYLPSGCEHRAGEDEKTGGWFLSGWASEACAFFFVKYSQTLVA